jgi:hypothetical protein
MTPICVSLHVDGDAQDVENDVADQDGSQVGRPVVAAGEEGDPGDGRPRTRPNA